MFSRYTIGFLQYNLWLGQAERLQINYANKIPDHWLRSGPVIVSVCWDWVIIYFWRFKEIKEKTMTLNDQLNALQHVTNEKLQFVFQMKCRNYQTIEMSNHMNTCLADISRDICSYHFLRYKRQRKLKNTKILILMFLRQNRKSLAPRKFYGIPLKNVWILVSWLQQKPADQDPHCFSSTLCIHINFEIAVLDWLWFCLIWFFTSHQQSFS